MDVLSGSDLTKEIRAEVIRKRELSNISDAEIDNQLISLVEEVVFDRTADLHLGITEKKKLVDSVFNSMRRMDILEPLLKDPSITEIMINGPDNIFIEKNGRSEKIPMRFETKEQLEDMI